MKKIIIKAEITISFVLSNKINHSVIFGFIKLSAKRQCILYQWFQGGVRNNSAGDNSSASQFGRKINNFD